MMRNLSETAYLVAMYRALAAERPEAKFQDPFARTLAGGKGEFLMELLGDCEQNTTALAVRTCAIDDMVQQLIAAENIDVVLNLGAGLDTRPYRLDLPPDLQWIEVDCLDILEYKAEQLKNILPVCGVQRIEVDLTNSVQRNSVFAQVNWESDRVLVIAEGLLAYLTESQVIDLAKDLHNCYGFNWWLFDLSSPFALEKSRSYSPQQLFDQYFADGQPTFLFAPAAGKEFFAPYGWKVKSFRSVWSELCRLHQSRGVSLYSGLMMRTSAPDQWRAVTEESGFVVLKRV
jgi:methyltransferase (TIGR00027 family)